MRRSSRSQSRSRSQRLPFSRRRRLRPTLLSRRPGDIACDPADGSFNGGQRHRHSLPPALHLRPARRRAVSRPCCRSETSSTTAGAPAAFPPVLRPLVGTGEEHHASGAGEPRVQQLDRHRLRPDGQCGRLLRLLRGCGGRPDQGLLQLQHRRLAPDRAQLELLQGRRLLRGLCHRSSGFARTWRPTRRSARSPTGTIRSSRRASTRPGSLSVRPLFQALYDYNADVVLDRSRPQLRALRAADGERRARPSRGVRQFIVGTGGKSLYSPQTPIANSEVRNSSATACSSSPFTRRATSGNSFPRPAALSATPERVL